MCGGSSGSTSSSRLLGSGGVGGARWGDPPGDAVLDGDLEQLVDDRLHLLRQQWPDEERQRPPLEQRDGHRDLLDLERPQQPGVLVDVHGDDLEPALVARGEAAHDLDEVAGVREPRGPQHDDHRVAKAGVDEVLEGRVGPGDEQSRSWRPASVAPAGSPASRPGPRREPAPPDA